MTWGSVGLPGFPRPVIIFWRFGLGLRVWLVWLGFGARLSSLGCSFPGFVVEGILGCRILGAGSLLHFHMNIYEGHSYNLCSQPPPGSQVFTSSLTATCSFQMESGHMVQLT